jgi:hypothetical protein
MAPMTAPPFLRVPDLVTVGRIQLGGKTVTVADRINHTGMWYETARRDGGLLLLLADATGPDVRTTEVVIEVIDHALSYPDENLCDRANPSLLLDYLRQMLGSLGADHRMACVAQAVLIQPNQGQFVAAYGGCVVPQHAPGGDPFDEIDLPVVGFPVLGHPADIGAGFPGSTTALGKPHRYFAGTDGLFAEPPAPGFGPWALRTFLGGLPTALPPDQVLTAVFAEAARVARVSRGDWPTLETAALMWRLLDG